MRAIKNSELKIRNSLPRLRLRVTSTAETLLRRGHPWLFAESIRGQNREGQLGELAVIFDRNDKFLAVGLFDPDSPIRVRVLHTGKPQNIDFDWWKNNLEQALQKRRGLFDEQTTGYRCINGESDNWPGVVLDRYSDTLVLKIYSGIWFSRLNEIVDFLTAASSILPRLEERDGVRSNVSQARPHPDPLPQEREQHRQFSKLRVVVRLSRNIQHLAEKFHLHDGQILRGAPLTEPVIFQENGLRFEADVLRGQKTGFFLDQRENRRIVETLAAEKKVLNAFSFSGGFSVYAARGGATSVTDLDISAHALAAARRNFALNSEVATIAQARHETIQTDVFEWLQKNSERRFDLMILDPPSLAKREAERAEAIRAYRKLVEGGIAHLAKGGTLVAASCSAHVSAEEFFGAVRESARASRREFQELQTTRHAPDHPATFKEAEYLKCIYLKFM